MQRLIVIGAGFAGMHAALSAARLRDLQGVSPDKLEIALIAPSPSLVIRPRLYEANPETMAAPLGELFNATDIRYVQGSVETINSEAGSVGYRSADGKTHTLIYDRLVLAAGSTGFRPPIPGLAEHGFGVDQIETAIELDRHLHALSEQPASKARNTVVVAGGGFTGIETATEMPERLRALFGANAEIRVLIVERGQAVGQDMGANMRPLIDKALRDAGVETRVGIGATALDATGVTLSSGERIDSSTVIWTAGMRATPLTMQIDAPRDNFGRLLVDRDLRVPGVRNIFATGDTAKAATDNLGNHSLMSCQHAKRLGAFAGNNAAAELLGVPTEQYHQRAYVTCLDLGEAGAIFTRGWDPQVELTGAEAKSVKREINTVWIYPPRADRAEVFAASKPILVLDL